MARYTVVEIPSVTGTYFTVADGNTGWPVGSPTAWLDVAQRLADRLNNESEITAE